MNVDTQVKGYGGKEADEYDENAIINKGNREKHREMLADILSYLRNAPSRFLDLGCGTGFFAEEIFRTFPGTEGVLLDGSDNMLSIASHKLEHFGNSSQFVQSMFNDIDWAALGKFDLVFSCLAIHHLSDDDKWALFEKINESLNEGGAFVLFDLFAGKDDFECEMLEYLACKDIQRNIRKVVEDKVGDITGLEINALQMDYIIDIDRRNKANEKDDEAELAHQLAHLKALPYKHVVQVFQEVRFAGLVCIK